MFNKLICVVFCWLVAASLARSDDALRVIELADFARKAADSQWVDVRLPNASGGETTIGSLLGEKGTVLVFLSTECPISNGYVPALKRLQKEFAEQGVAIVGLNPNSGHSLKQIQAHAREFQIPFPLLKDVGGTIAKSLGAKTCPEVIVFNAARDVVYKGRVDDRYLKRGGAASEVGRADLELALRQLVAGKPIEVAKTDTIGCPIDFPNTKQVAVQPDEKQVPTYCREISRILQQHCQECHRAGGIGPFSLRDYQDAVRWADDIQTFTASRQMPPWKAAPNFGEFAHPRHMSQSDIELIAAWVRASCPEGNRSDLPPPREFSNSWKLGREPDAVFEIPEYTLAADGPDEYRCFVLPTQFDGDRYVTAMEVLPGNARVVHHVIAFLDVNGKARELDAKHPGPGYITSAGFPGFFPSGGLGGWAPGNQPAELREGTARLLPKNADIALQVHYHRSGKPETDRTKVALYFSQVPVTRAVRNIPVMPFGGPLGDMRIPANDANYEVRASIVLPMEMQAVAVTPHMHLLGKDMTVIAKLPDGTTKPLIRIEQWDFNWQETYPFREPITLPRLTRLEMVAHFDNSKSNPANPSRPPQLVTWGESTNEEMCIAFVEMVSAQPEPTPLKPPTRDEQLRFLLSSQLLDTETPRADQAKLWLRFLRRMNDLEKNGGRLSEEKQ